MKILEHHPMSPSAASRWMACKGSVRQIEIAAEHGIVDTESPSAEEGSLAHEVAAACLRLQIDPPVFVNEAESPSGMFFTDDHAPYVAEYVNYIHDLRDQEKDSKLLVEHNVDLGKAVTGAWGTIDALIVSERRLHIVDFKFGKGVRVTARENPQLMYYAQAFSEFWWEGDGEVVLHIFQPRYPHQEAWSPTKHELARFGDALHDTSTAIALGGHDDDLVPGDEQCRFCPARPVCPALAAQTNALMDAARADMGAVTPESIGALLDKAPQVERFIKSLRSYAHDLLEQGREVPGWKLVHNRPNRRWGKHAEMELTAVLGDDAYEPRRLVGLGAAQRLLKERGLSADAIDGMTERPDARAVLARAGDARPALGGGASPADLLADMSEDG